MIYVVVEELIPEMSEGEHSNIGTVAFMATHSGILAWEIPWAEELGGLQFIGLQRVRHD